MKPAHARASEAGVIGRKVAGRVRVFAQEAREKA